ncbi:MAG TPA: PAS domain S-box protein [Bryobacteraceae bacterium]|nr:PAS domain S-box protein [Bryobacteraceae bacterium]
MSSSPSGSGGFRQSRPLEPHAASILESVLLSLSDGVIVADRNGRFILVNPAARRLLSDVPTEVAASEFSARYGLYKPDQTTLFPVEELPLIRAIRGEVVRDVEMFVRRGESRGTWVSASATPLRDEASGLEGGVVVFRDITASKQNEEALRSERDMAAAVVDTVASLVLVLDKDGRILGFNRACEKTAGRTFEQVRGRFFWEVVLPPEEVDSARAAFEEARTGRFPGPVENHWVSSDGSRRLITWANTSLLAPDGSVEFVVGTGTDLTARRHAEDELRRANHMLRVVIETSPLAIVTMDFSGNVKSWNRAAERMFGWLEQEVLGQPFPIVPEEDEAFFRDNLDRLRRAETIAGVERQRRRKDGTLIDVALWNAPQLDAEGRVIGGISVIADMTDRKRLEEQFRQAQKMEAVGRLAGGVAHDFNNLLTVIGGYTQMLLETMQADHPLRSPIEEIDRASASAAALTQQLLAFSRRQIVTPQLFDLNHLVASLDKMLHRLIGEDVELSTLLAPQLPNVKVDAGQMEQVVMNLVVNARDAMPRGGTITIRTEVAEFNERSPEGVGPGRYVVLSVADTGRGMTEETKLHIFEPFFTTKGRGKGTGLGLSTVYGIVKQSGGEVAVTTAPGEGSTFRIFLPALDRAAAAGVDGAPPPERKRGTETVLLAEDDAALRNLVRGILESRGYSVLLAVDAAETVAWCERHPGPIHLFLTDVVMPGMSGQDLAALAARLRPRLKILYMSGYTDHASLEHGVLDNGTAFLRKPFTPEILLAKIREVLDGG